MEKKIRLCSAEVARLLHTHLAAPTHPASRPTCQRVPHVEGVAQQQRPRGVQRLGGDLLVLHAANTPHPDRLHEAGPQRLRHLRVCSREAMGLRQRVLTMGERARGESGMTSHPGCLEHIIHLTCGCIVSSR